MKTIKLGQIFDVDGQQYILGHTGYNEYNLVGITKYYYSPSPSPAVFHDNEKVEFSKEDIKQISVNRFDDLVMLPQNIKLCDFFDDLRFDELQLGQKFTVLGTDDIIYQKIVSFDDANTVNLQTYHTHIIMNNCRVKLVV